MRKLAQFLAQAALTTSTCFGVGTPQHNAAAATPNYEEAVASVVAEGAADEDDYVAYAMWIPPELFRLMLQLSGSSRWEGIEQEVIENLPNYAVLAIGQADIDSDGACQWYPRSEVCGGLRIRVSDTSNDDQVLTEAQCVAPPAKLAAFAIQPLLFEAFGDNSSGLFFWFGSNASGSVLSASKSGTCEITFTRRNGNTVTRTILLPPKALLTALDFKTSDRDAATRNDPPVDQSTHRYQPEDSKPNLALADSCEERAMKLKQRGRFAEAIEWIDKSLVARGGHSRISDPFVCAALSQKAGILFQLGRLDDAMSSLSYLDAESMNVSQDRVRIAVDVLAWRLMGAIAMERKDYALAKKALARSTLCESQNTMASELVRNHNNLDNQLMAVRIELGLGNLAAAEASLLALEKLVRTTGSENETWEKRVAQWGAALAEKQGDYRKAVRLYEQAVDRAVEVHGDSSVDSLTMMSHVYRLSKLLGDEDILASLEKSAAAIVVSGNPTPRQPVARRLSKPAIEEAVRKPTRSGPPTDYGIVGGLTALTFALVYGCVVSRLRKGSRGAYKNGLILACGFLIAMIVGGLTLPLKPPFATEPLGLLFGVLHVGSIVSLYKKSDERGEYPRLVGPRLGGALAAILTSLAAAVICPAVGLLIGCLIKGGQRTYLSPFELAVVNYGWMSLVGGVGVALLVGVGAVCGAGCHYLLGQTK